MSKVYSETQVRAAETTGVMRYVLAASMALALISMTTVLITVT